MIRALLVILVLSLTSCIKLPPEFWDEDMTYVMFTTVAQEADTYKEIRYYAKEFRGDSLVVVDSVSCKASDQRGQNEVFPKGEGCLIGMRTSKISIIDHGLYEVVAVKKDNSIVKKEFGNIIYGIPHRYYKAYLTSGGIIVEWLY
ncbi:hypothetical protein [Dyadobacter luticola]|uniref:Lipoprotein n=1 Tax=Dyadobacter luticola TaxID=1979387 RepID=A0A5R9KRZ4_9BACT|nr:hypothetical protein [Dyadobacter luticola]TLU98888.1 hypothetical protein FEN17_20060 [Dyadobacter luticola]